MNGISPLRAALKSVCPRCGEGRMFQGLLTVAPACANCGLDLAAYDIGDGPAYFVIVLGGMLVCFLAVMLEFAARPPLWVHMVLWPPVILLLSILLLRGFKGWLLAMHYTLKSRGVKDD
jgi:uncharacterized protein (DUF983 family)